jgi:hypothetical protein
MDYTISETESIILKNAFSCGQQAAYYDKEQSFMMAIEFYKKAIILIESEKKNLINN